VSFTASLRGSLGYTSTEAQFERGSEQIQDIPKSLTKLGLDYVGRNAPFEVSVSLVKTGDLYVAYPYRNLGMPQTLHVTYAYRF